MQQMRGGKFRLSPFLVSELLVLHGVFAQFALGRSTPESHGAAQRDVQNVGPDKNTSTVRSKELSVAGYSAVGHLATLGHLELLWGSFPKF